MGSTRNQGMRKLSKVCLNAMILQLTCFAAYSYVYDGVLPVFVSMYHLCLVCVEARRRRLIPWIWNYRPGCQCWEVNLGRLQERSVLIITGLSLKPQVVVSEGPEEETGNWGDRNLFWEHFSCGAGEHGSAHRCKQSALCMTVSEPCMQTVVCTLRLCFPHVV